MAAQQKPKPTKGTRNDNRKNGKAPKKNPKPQHTLSPEEKAVRVAEQAKRKAYAEARAVEEQKKLEAEAAARLAKNKRASDAQKKRAAAQQAASLIKHSLEA